MAVLVQPASLEHKGELQRAARDYTDVGWNRRRLASLDNARKFLPRPVPEKLFCDIVLTRCLYTREIQAQTPSVHALFNGHRKLYPHSLTCPHPNPYIPMPSVLAALLLECRESKVCRCVKREREKRRQRPYGNKGEKRGGAPAFEVRREAG